MVEGLRLSAAEVTGHNLSIQNYLVTLVIYADSDQVLLNNLGPVTRICWYATLPIWWSMGSS